MADMTYLGIAFVLTISLGVPVAFCLGISALIFLLVSGNESLMLIPTLMFAGIDSFPLMAIPFFIMAGDLAEKCGVLPNLVAFAQALVGHFRAGLAHVSIVTEMMLSGVTGTAVGDAAAIGSIFIPSMVREGYDKKFAAVLTAAASIMGPIIPPSVGMLVYAFIQGGGVSVAALFLAGCIPGAMVGLGLMLLCYVLARVRNYPLSHETFRLRTVLATFKGAILGFAVIFIILGGILMGIFTPTEAGSIAVVYTLIIGVFVTKKLKFSDIIQTILNTAITSGVVFLIFSTARVLAWLLTSAGVPQKLGVFLMSISPSPIFFITFVILFLVIIGFCIEAMAAMIMFVPVLAPIADSYGINPVHFGLIFVMAIQLALITPPVALSLFVTCKIAGIGIDETWKEFPPFLVLLLTITLLVAFWPDLTLWLPRLLGYVN